MDYPATQMFVNDDDDLQEEEENDENTGTPLRADKKVKVGIIIVDSVLYPVHKGENKVGRIDTCSIVIDHTTISKEHAEIEAGAGSKSTFISDLGSLNKTRLNDVILRPGRLYQLQDGDVLRFGSVKAVFKTAEALPSLWASDDFVIPETPGPPIAKDVHPIIPGTPDLSFDRSNRSSDVSMIAGTQEPGNTAGRSSPILSRQPSSIRVKTRDAGSKTSGNLLQDISDLETQKNFEVPDSDDDDEEENIFDMPTQRSDIHDDETQKFTTDNVRAVMLSKYTVTNIEDMETQKLFKADGDDGVKSIENLQTQKLRVENDAGESINDIETQKFGVGDLANDSLPPSRRVAKNYHPISINDMETQKFDVDHIAGGSLIGQDKTRPISCSINDMETQKPEIPPEDCQDSETDEEGIFDNSDTGSVDMFNAPTQLIIIPPRENPAEDKKEEEEEITQHRVAEIENVQEDEKRGETAASEAETRAEVNVDEEKKSAMNDSIESKLNHMFDEVNESVVEEPTQMLTQHLENLLEATQVAKIEPNELQTEVVSGAVDVEDNRDPDNVARSEPSENVPKQAKPVIRLPEILSTQELFADLPAVNIFRTPRRGRIKVSPISDGIASPKSDIAENSKTPDRKKGRSNTRNRSDAPKRAGSEESVKSTSSKRSKSTESGDSGVGRIEESRTPSKKAKTQNTVCSTPSSTRKLRKVSPKVEEETKEAEIRKGLPLKKRGSSIIPSPPTPRKRAEVVVASTPRAGTRSSRSSAVDSPKATASKGSTPNSIIKANNEEPKLPRPILPAKTEAFSRNKKGTRSKKLDEPISEVKSSAETRRATKKQLDTSAAVSDEKVSPVKRPRTTTTATLPSNVNDRSRPVGQGAKRTNANSRQTNLSQSSDSGINQNESLPTRSRRGRNTGNESSADSSSNSSMAVDNSNIIGHQPSLESQEIQAILGVADHGDKKAVKRGESRVFRSQETGENRASSRPGFLGFPKANTSKKHAEDGFEKPVGRAVRKTRQLDAIELESKEETIDAGPKETGKKSTRQRRGKVVDNSPNGTSSDDHTVEKTTPTRVRTKRRASGAKNSTESSDDEVKVKVESKNQTLTPVRGKRAVSRRTLDNEVDASPPKRGRKRGKGASGILSEEEIEVSQSSTTSSTSSPLRRGRSFLSTPSSAATSSARIKHKVLFTGLNDPGLISIVNGLGGTVTEKPNDCTALVTDKVRRTYKFLCGMAMAVPIVSIEWLKQSERRGCFLDTGDFLLKDPVEEAKFKFDLRQSLARATGSKLLDGYTVVLTPNTAPPPIAEMKGIIQACGGKALVRAPSKWPIKSLIISRQEDVKNAKKFATKAPKSVKILTVEFILTGILRHELNFEEHKLDVD